MRNGFASVIVAGVILAPLVAQATQGAFWTQSWSFDPKFTTAEEAVGERCWRRLNGAAFALSDNPRDYEHPDPSTILIRHDTCYRLRGGSKYYVGNYHALLRTCPNDEYFDWIALECVDREDDPERNQGKPTCDSAGGTNPINIATGNKYQAESLFTTHGADPISISYHYNSLAMGKKWRMNYELALPGGLSGSVVAAYGSNDQAKRYAIKAMRPDGSAIRFANKIDFRDPIANLAEWQSEPNVQADLKPIIDSDSGQVVGFRLELPSGVVERYTLDGVLFELQSAAGQWQQVMRAADGRLSEIRNAFGQSVTFAYLDESDGSHTIVITDPGGNSYRVHHNTEGDVQEIVYPDDTPGDPSDDPRRTFLYEDIDHPRHLTGIIGARGGRIATWTYDNAGRAISSEHAGGTDHRSVRYNPDGTSTVIDAFGTARTYNFVTEHGLIKVDSVTGGACDQCGGDTAYRTYDDNGFLSSKTDHNGNVTTYLRDDRGRELSRTDAADTPEARTITTTWHPGYGKPLTIAEPGRITTHSYDTEGRLLSTSVQAQP